MSVRPSISLSPSSGSFGTNVTVSGSNFSIKDKSCLLSSHAVKVKKCSILNGSVNGSFIVPNVTAGSYEITVTAHPTDDSASANFTVTGPSTNQTGPSISFDSSSGPFGSTVNVSGSNFSIKDTSCSISGDPVGSAPTCAITNGTLTGSFVVANTPAGSYAVTATGSPAGDSAYATFSIIGGTPSITLDSQSGSAGTTVQVSGTFFSASDSNCTLTDDSAGENETCSLSYGAVTASFIVANVSPGNYTITVTGSPDGDWASQPFTVTNSSLSISLNETSAPVGATIQVSGSGFPSSDSNCTLSGDVVNATSCSLSDGELSGSFVVANVTTGSYNITAVSSPSNDSASANFTVTGPVTNQTTTIATNSTTTGAPDFSITSSTFVKLARGGTGVAAINVTSLNGFSSAVTLSASWVGRAPAGVNLTLVSPVTPTPGSPAADSLTVTTSTNASTGTFTVQVTGTSGSLTHSAGSNITLRILQVETTSTGSTTANSTTTSLQSSPSCAVSSATSGSALAPLAEKLRDFRDRSILKTRTGVAFMTLFNAWYYSFSPPVASYVSTHQTQRTLFRYGLYPLIGILYASYYTYMLLSPLDSEAAAVTTGLIAAGMIGLVYVSLPLSLAGRILRRKGVHLYMKSSHLATWSAISGVIVGVAYLSRADFAMGLSIVSLILSALTLGANLGTQALSQVNVALPTSQIAALRRCIKSLAWRATIQA
ncbi:MAG TPA: CFI-box-CTERM domain-containing protein [Candidatus Dormibacteraeota bacterium]|nr:CFI-box-CTERM domain-containing protein [Candidatus Dormibacteraeota bacterium]